MNTLTPIRTCQSTSAVVFLHGFSGDPDGTWAHFPYLLGLEQSLAAWNILTFGYNTSLLPGTRGVWSADPDLPTLSTLFFTELDIPPLCDCTDIAVVAHSMGGLIVQRSLIDNPNLTKKMRHLFLFGTPSAGIRKANFLARLFGPFVGEQVHNMEAKSSFVTQLRAGWDKTFGPDPPFQFYTIAGDKDQFVTPDTALEPFAPKYRRVVVGDHLSMVKPKDATADVVRLLVSALTRSAEPAGPMSELRLAAELGNQAPEGMAIARAAAAGRRQLTEAGVVEAALALDRAGQQPEAVRLLESNQQLGTDVKGTLAGRIKRRWVQEGQEGDAYWALGLYESALQTARSQPETQDTIDQIFYHAINVAFLKQVAFGEAAAAREMAGLALMYAKKKQPPDVWSVATEAEAWLYLGDEQKALEKYRQVIAMSPEKWKLMSTGQQAQQIARKLGNTALQEQLRNMFEPPPIGSLAATS
jgi:pimeloyl-ACP methyl ester carboxylesterase